MPWRVFVAAAVICSVGLCNCSEPSSPLYASDHHGKYSPAYALCIMAPLLALTLRWRWRSISKGSQEVFAHPTYLITSNLLITLVPTCRNRSSFNEN
ncbi:hypothetical protein BDY19DRAFT_238560 [Irpex rosettiformis]|uniref:Uncharacterized protein n=1 Tax=Irpex rosettiformis TaxID=378272 RepID=A0ACB8U012_9APHY|nr:hypothetical protein BDY19DRAFT_238560 [Irpex rosettiformis]